MKPLFLSLCLVLTTPLLPLPASAQAAATQAATPGAQIVATGNQILATLQQRRAEFRKDPAALRSYIDSQIRNTFDSLYAARLVLGVHGRGASDADVKLFADALIDNLMQRYGSALLDFEGKPRLRLKSETPLPNGRGMKISTELLRENGAPVPVDYLVRNNGGWKIFDVMIEGVSYVQTFRTQFDTPLQQKSIAQVAADLRNGALQPPAPASAKGGR
ncbi:MlaC/ttg2D family ABC transporter substrate-binding protein [Thermomonas hydrothermalis]|uniref:Phospholipid transport system substrate-binding protein n=1 Tax=Thermomonas hydrothermalis TaxID=213588 RepID=A0A1M4TXJ9_9GAMM|nr:ABC transporter substrate-binding protein [Thermomonas hydrothermalis]SHE49170.1 phospholipid transport system substrate-binding protein [Thermomonas hydrothermalis]